MGDDADADEIYLALEKKIIPLYYKVDEDGIPRDWIKVMKSAIVSIAPAFSSRRMVKEYVNKFYRNALNSALK